MNFNQRSVSEIFEFVTLIARLVNQKEKGDEILASYESELQSIADAGRDFQGNPASSLKSGMIRSSAAFNGWKN